MPHRDVLTIAALLRGGSLIALLLGILLSPPAGVAAAVPAPGGALGADSEEALKVTLTIKCFCGTCVNQTLQECSCGVASRERGRVEAALAAGETPEALIAAYIAEHGPQVRLVPERRGLNYIGWLMPFLAAGVGLMALLVVLLTWQRRAAAAAAVAVDPGPMDEQEMRYRARLARELQELDR